MRNEVAVMRNLFWRRKGANDCREIASRGGGTPWRHRALRSAFDCEASDRRGDGVADCAFTGALVRKDGPSMRMVMQ